MKDEFMNRIETFKRLFAGKADADRALLGALAALDPGAPSTEVALRTISHMTIVDRIFLAHMRREGHRFESANAIATPLPASLSDEVFANDRALIAFIEGLDETGLAESLDFTFTDGDPGRMSRAEMLLHLATHGSYHRGQASWMLTLDGVAAPPDGLATFLHQAEPEARRRLPRSTESAPATAPAPAKILGSPEAERGPTSNVARLQALTERLRATVANGLRLDKSVKFDLKEAGVIFVGGGRVDNENRPADLVLTISLDDLRAIGQGTLSPTGAVTRGRLRLSDMGLALSLQKGLKALFATSG